MYRTHKAPLWGLIISSALPPGTPDLHREHSNSVISYASEFPIEICTRNERCKQHTENSTHTHLAPPTMDVLPASHRAIAMQQKPQQQEPRHVCCASCPWHVALQTHILMRCGKPADLSLHCARERRFFALLGIRSDAGLGCLGLRRTFATEYPGSAILIQAVQGGSPALRRTQLFKTLLDALPAEEFTLQDVPAAVLIALGKHMSPAVAEVLHSTQSPQSYVQRLHQLHHRRRAPSAHAHGAMSNKRPRHDPVRA
eukprot:TRINITY_DN11824_c0_g2_i1.p1 TRINITY_DN11824_c0_g2~~TRINITY_DN11824_c0_g2_i1.p1  ORF type:complete len:279 (-),score=10.92 TRINITY_DN11824_c0_g2_i1:248-1015(-)